MSSPGTFVNFMCYSMYDDDNEEVLTENFKEMFGFMDKFRYKIKELAGDYYYEKMSREETIKKAFL